MAERRQAPVTKHDGKNQHPLPCKLPSEAHGMRLCSRSEPAG